MAYNIVSHTPTWVWLLLATLAWFGLRQAVTQHVSLRRVTVMPLALVGLSLYGTVSVFGEQPLALLAWAGAAACATVVVMQRAVPAGTHFELSCQRFTLPGSWMPLALMMAIFCTKYAVGITNAVHPSLLHGTAVALSISAAYGVFSGILVARAIRLWRLAAATEAAWHQRTTSTDAGLNAQFNL